MDNERPAILAYRENPGELSMTEFRMRKVMSIAQDSIRLITDQTIAACCNHVKRYFPRILRSEPLEEDLF